MVWGFLEKDKISPDCAAALYTGIVHDTGVFQYSSTSPETMRIAAQLMEKGIPFSKIIDETYFQKSYVQNRAAGCVLANSRLFYGGKLIMGCLTAAEMGAQDRFSSVILYEEDVIDGALWEATRDGIADVLRKLPKLPPCVIVFPVCTHHFAGVDMDSIYASLEAEFPTIDFVRAFMDPIMQKHGLPPDQRLRKVMYDPLPDCTPAEKTVTLLGAEFQLEPDSDLCRLFEKNGYTLLQLQDCKTYEDYLSLSKGETFLCVHPNGHYGISQTAKRLNRPYCYLPMSFDYASISASLEQIAAKMSLLPLDEAAGCAPRNRPGSDRHRLPVSSEAAGAREAADRIWFSCDRGLS